MAENHLADLTHEEFSALYLQTKVPEIKKFPEEMLIKKTPSGYVNWAT